MRLIPVQPGVHSALQIRQTWAMAVHQTRGKRLLSFGGFSCIAGEAGQLGCNPLWFGLITHRTDAEMCTAQQRHSSAVTHQLQQQLLVLKSVFFLLNTTLCNVCVYSSVYLSPQRSSDSRM